MKTRILLIHNHYRSSVPSGENQVVESEARLLHKHGHYRLMKFFRYSDKIHNKGFLGTVTGAMATPWNPFSAKSIKKAVSDSKTDVVHAHNTFPLNFTGYFSIHRLQSRTGPDVAQLSFVLSSGYSYA